MQCMGSAAQLPKRCMPPVQSYVPSMEALAKADVTFEHILRLRADRSCLTWGASLTLLILKCFIKDCEHVMLFMCRA